MRRKSFVFLLMLVALVAVVVTAGSASNGSIVHLPVLMRGTPIAQSIKLTQYGDAGFGCTITDIANAGDGRLFVVQQDGVISIIDPDGHVLDTPFLDLDWVPNPCTGDTDLNGEDDNWELGLLGLAFHPDYQTNGEFFVVYNDPLTYAIRLARYTVSADPNVADATTKQIMITVEKSLDDRYPNGRSPVHNGGDINFGPDGYLYVGFGDGSPDPERFGVSAENIPPDPIPGDPDNNGQRIDTLLGKIIRIDVDEVSPHSPNCGSTGYGIPGDNPFFNTTDTCKEIWSSGWRNPWRFSFDSATGDMYIGDVGEWERDEVNFEAAGDPGGRNYGWNCYEGTFDHTAATHLNGQCTATYTPPIWDYFEHVQGSGIKSVTGGYVYNGAANPGLARQYVFADFSDTFSLWRISSHSHGAGMTKMNITNISDLPAATHLWTTFGVDQNEELYIGEFNPSSVLKAYVYRVDVDG